MDLFERCPRMTTLGGFRAWPDKKRIEVDAVRDLVAGLHEHGERSLSDVVPREETSPQTPPDVLARNERGERVGIEVVELVDGDLVGVNVARLANREPELVRCWSGREVVDAVAALVTRKNAKQFDGGDYAERWLVIHCAEPIVAWDEVERELPGLVLAPGQFDAVYLVRDFDPATGGYPWSRVYVREG